MQRQILIIMAGVLCLLMLPAMASAQTPDDTPTFVELDAYVRAVDDMARRGVLTQEQADEQVTYYLAQASELAGEPVDRDELARRASFTLAARVQGWFSFVTLIWVAGSILITLGIGYFFAAYILPLLWPLLPDLLEIALYVGCGAFLYYGWVHEDAAAAQFIALPGVLTLPFAVLYSLYRHKWLARLLVRYELIENIQINKPEPERVAAALFHQPLYAAWILVWGTLAMLYGSAFIGFLTVVLVGAWAGFFALGSPLLTSVGFVERAVVPRVTATGFVFLLVAIIARITGFAPFGLDVFLPGMEWTGTLVYFSGLLVMSAKWFWKDRRSYYVQLQVLTLASGVGALLIGSVFGLEDLRAIAGEYFLVYIVEKYAEVRWFRQNIAIATLTLGILLYGIAYVLRNFPDFFRFVA